MVEHFIVDFERAAINAIDNVFPASIVKGYYRFIIAQLFYAEWTENV